MAPNLQLLGLLCLCLCVAAASSQPPHRRRRTTQVAADHRAADVARQCRSVLSSAPELADGADGLVSQMAFSSGDWHQDAGHAPLMPFPRGRTRTDVPEACPGPRSSREAEAEATPLATFTLVNVDPARQWQRRQRTRRAVKVSGVLSLSISTECCYSEEPPRKHESPEFRFEPTLSKFIILLEGVYTETTSSSSSNSSEWVLCMVGNAVLPMRSGNSTDPWDWAKNAGASTVKLPVMADSNVVLMLRYPKQHTLTSRAVRGEMTSTNAESDHAYFDTVHLVSRLGYFARYQFRPEVGELAAAGAGCIPRPFFCDNDDNDDDNCAEGLYRGVSFCDIVHQFAPPGYGGMLASVVPNWKCNSTDEFCSRLGPFVSTAGGRGAINAEDFAIAVQDVRCEPTTDRDGKPATLVSAVFRAVSPWEDQSTATRRSGLSGMTMSAEGVWSASTGQLCMTGCLDAGEAACGYRVSFYVATTFSLTRRGVILGQIAAMDGSHFPLSFQRSVPPRKTWGNLRHHDGSLHMQYSYTKVEQAAGEFLRKSSSSRSFAVKSFLSYPKDTGDDMESFSHLCNVLFLQFEFVRKLPFMPEWIEGSGLLFQILSVESHVGSYHPTFQLLNVSAEFTVPGEGPLSAPVMSLEGVYSQEDGRLYLIGCRNIRAPWRWRAASKIGGLENGMDCSIEVEVEYPPTTAWWPFSPTAKAYISSTRVAGDPLHFSRTMLRSSPVFYRGHSDALSEKNVEGLLCITTLSATIAAALSQLCYMKSHPDVAPYVSLVMLGVQALGYGMVLITEARTLPAWPTSPNYKIQWDMDCSVRSLTLVALFLTLRLTQKVRRARSPLEPGRVPSDTAVLLYTLAAHSAGVLLFIVAVSRSPPVVVRNTWGAVVERYVGLVKEWFLLPQVVGNAVWRVNCRLLRNSYYASVTGVWLLPHVYGYLRPPPVVNMCPQGEADGGSTVANVAAPLISVVLAVSIYVQHRWNYKIVGWAFGKEQNKVQHVY